MGRLKAQPARLRTLAPTHKIVRDAHGHSAVLEPWRRWYWLARWKHPKWGLRIRVLMRDLFTCQWPGCGRIEADTSQLVADHKTPHRGDPELFWSDDNIWTLCVSCHNSLKQAEERRPRW